MIDLITPYLPYAAWCFGGAIAGFGTCAVLTMGKVAEANDAADWESTAHDYADRAWENEKAHTRCSDALETARNRIERALEQITPGANATVSRIGRILRGEQG